MQPITISVRELAKTLGVGKTTAHALIRDNVVESFLLGGRRLVTLASINALVEQRSSRTVYCQTQSSEARKRDTACETPCATEHL